MIIYGACMSIDRDAGLPPWRQLAGLLRKRIAAGEFDEGRLPSQRYLADEYGVALSTVRKALAALQEEGLITTERGWGSSVVHAGSPPPYDGEPA